MKKILFFLIVALTSCTAISKDIAKNDLQNFKFKHLEAFEIRDDTKELNLQPLDTAQLKNFMNGYPPLEEVCLYSNQTNVGALELFTVVTPSKACHQEIYLIVTQKNKFIGRIQLAEKGNCGVPSESKSTFINDSTFVRNDLPDLSYTYLDSADHIGKEYEKIETTFRIKTSGEIEPIDTITRYFALSYSNGKLVHRPIHKDLDQPFSFPPKEFHRFFDFSSIETTLSDSLKINYLKRIADSKFLVKSAITSSTSIDYENYHFLDFNADGQLDILYDGRIPSGIESNNVVFYLNRGDSLVPVIKLNGDFTQLQLKDQQLQSFQLLKSPCCASITYSLENYTFNASENCFETYVGSDYYNSLYGQLNDPTFCVSISSQYDYILHTEFPDEIHMKQLATVTKKAFVTRIPLPATNTDFEEESYVFHTKENKAISHLNVGTPCVILSEKKDDMGNVHCFITFKNAEKNKNYLSHSPFQQYGWVDKNCLTK